MKPSILRTETGVCYICRRHTETALHHIYYGAKRKMSDENGFTVFLCPDCHQYAPYAVHRCRETDLMLKAGCQRSMRKRTAETILWPLWAKITWIKEVSAAYTGEN